VSKQGLADEQLLVHDDETDFYGKQYWLNHQNQDLGYPDIYTRARSDLIERNLHWLNTLLKYKRPPAKIMEIGCSHGSFVALMNQAGYDASGVELSPWVVNFGTMTFDIPISVGPLQNLKIPLNSLDVIVMMDILEHLPNPASMVGHCMSLLKPNGFLLIQTPQFKTEMQYESLLENKSPFLEQLKSDEHLYLFSEHSVTKFFDQFGAKYIQFEPAIFAQYDMFFVVSREPFDCLSPEQAQSHLTTPKGRFALALLDLRENLMNSDADRAARQTQINTLTALLEESEHDRAARLIHINTLTELLEKK
jgi:2-polyprenyl-3-methyl-5-hydroxy-6-metoxy-1,4-benzoquinol methylase